MIKRKYSILRKLKANQTMSAGIFWSECATRVVSYLCALIVMLIILSVALSVSTERLTQISEYAAIVLAVLWCIPIARNTRFRLRDAGYTAKSYLWLLLPIVGWIVFIARLCAKSLPRKADGSFL